MKQGGISLAMIASILHNSMWYKYVNMTIVGRDKKETPLFRQTMSVL